MMRGKLPIFRLDSLDMTEKSARVIAERILPGLPLSSTRYPAGFRFEAGPTFVDVSTQGGFWMADTSRQWSEQSKVVPDVSPQGLESIARQYLIDHGLMPSLAFPFGFGSAKVSGTRLIDKKLDGQREERQIDWYVALPIMVYGHPFIGGGAEFSVTIAHDGRVIAASGCWRNVVETQWRQEVPRKALDERFSALTSTYEVRRDGDPMLAYYAAPSFVEQAWSYPVQVYRSHEVLKERKVPMRKLLLPAVQKLAVPQSIEGDVVPIRPLPIVTVPQFGALARSHESERRTAGAVWISGNLVHSRENANGFARQWAAAGWEVRFNDGDERALESNWIENNDETTGIDGVSMVFYAGHASSNAVQLSPPNFPRMELGRIVEAGKRWGDGRLNWLTLAACSTLADMSVRTAEDCAMTRWSPVFGGLHALMGYASDCSDTPYEGERYASLARTGRPLIDAWLQTARECQRSTDEDGAQLYAAAMWAVTNNSNPRSDHAWGQGGVAEDPTAPQRFRMLISPC